MFGVHNTDVKNIKMDMKIYMKHVYALRMKDYIEKIPQLSTQPVYYIFYNIFYS